METPNPLAELTAGIQLAKQLASQARAELETSVPLLIEAIRHQSGQSRKIEKILWSLWNDEHQVNLCSELAGLDCKIAKAAISMIAARAYLSGDADDLLRTIIEKGGSQTPVVNPTNNPKNHE